MSLITKNADLRWFNGVIPFKEESSVKMDVTLHNNIIAASKEWEKASPRKICRTVG